MPRQQTSDVSTVPVQTVDPTADHSSGDQSASGSAAVSRIANADDLLPTYDAALADMLGPIASQISPSDIPPEVTTVARQVVELAASRAASDSTSASTPAVPAKTPAVPANKAPAKEPTIPDEIISLRNEIDAFIADKVANVIALTPGGQALAQKFRSFDQAHPGLVLEALVLAAVVGMGRDLSIPTLTHSFDLGHGLTLGGGINLGSIRHIMVKSISATISYKSGGFSAQAGVARDDKSHLTTSESVDYKNGNFDAQGSFSRDFTGKTSTLGTQFTEKDIELLGFKIDEALASYKHTSPDGKPSTDTLRFQLKTALDGANLTVGAQETWAPAKPAKAGKGAPAADPGRTHTEQLTENVALPPVDGFKLTLGATENFGPNHARDAATASVQMPAWHDVTVTVGETMPFGAGTGGRPVTTVSALYKGVTFTLSHGATNTPDPKFGFAGTTATASQGAWSVGISVPIKF